MRELWLKIFYASGARVYSLFIGFMILTITARWLGPEGRGIIAAVTTWVGLFSTFGYLSLGQVAIHRATEMRGRNWLAPTLGSLLFLNVVIVILGWAVSYGLYWFTGGSVYSGLSPVILLIGFLALPFMIWEHYGSSLLIAVDKLTIYNRAQMSGRTVGLLMVVLAWWLNWGIPGVLVSLLVAQAIVSMGGITYLVSSSETSVRPDKINIIVLLKGALKLHLNAIGSFVSTSIGVLIINHYMGAAETGFYHLAFRLSNILLVSPTAASQVIYGKVTDLGADYSWFYHRKVLLFLTIGMIAISIIAALLAPRVIPFVFGEKFAPSVGLFQLMLIALIGMTFSIVMAAQWIGRGMFWQVSAIALIIGSLVLVANFLLVPRYGAYGAVWAILITYSFSVLINGAMALWCEVRFRRGHRTSIQPFISAVP
jgi:O-antigen/teichoic acid export membrane protein